MAEKSNVKLPGKVEKVFESTHPSDPDKAQICVENADPLYQEIRVENTLKDKEGKSVGLKEGAAVEVKIEADPNATVPKHS